MFVILTHWGRVTHICVGNLTITGSGNGLWPGRRQAITWPSVGILLIGPLGTNFSEMLIEIHTFSFTKIHLIMSSGKWRPFCLGHNVLRMQGKYSDLGYKVFVLVKFASMLHTKACIWNYVMDFCMTWCLMKCTDSTEEGVSFFYINCASPLLCTCIFSVCKAYNTYSLITKPTLCMYGNEIHRLTIDNNIKLFNRQFHFISHLFR